MTAREEFVKALDAYGRAEREYEAACLDFQSVPVKRSRAVKETRARVLAAYDAASQPVAGVGAVAQNLDRIAKEIADARINGFGNAVANEAERLRAPPKAEPAVGDVDALAQFIRIIDGDNTMGAGELAERILTHIAAPTHDAAGVEKDAVIEECARLLHMTKPEILLAGGEMSAQELRTVQAFLINRAVAIRALKESEAGR